MVAFFLDGGVGGRYADVLVKSAVQARAGAEGGHLAAVDQNYKPLAQGGGLGRFKRSVDFRFLFVRLRLFAENLSQRVDALFRTVFQVHRGLVSRRGSSARFCCAIPNSCSILRCDVSFFRF